MANGKRKRESEFFRKQRAMRERILERVGVGSETGQRLLDKWWRENQAGMSGRGKPANPDEAVAA